MTPQETRATLIARTIAVIANDGLDKTTTKAVVRDTGINEAYIYRHYSDKEDLLSKTFDSLDTELVTAVLQHLPIMRLPDLDTKTRCRMYFTAVWQFLLGNREKCLAFVQYYYSPYFKRNSYAAHQQRYAPLVEQFSPFFRPRADVWLILNHILNVMLDFAVKVHNGQMPEEDNYAEHVFLVIYTSIEQYFKTSTESEAQL